MLFPPLVPPPATAIDIIGNYFLLGAGIIVAAFALFYGFFLNWRSTPSGRSVMYFVIGLVAMLAHSIVTRAFGGDYLFRDLVRAAVYGYVAVSSGRLLWNLVTIWSRGNKASDAIAVVLPWRERWATRTKARYSDPTDRAPRQERGARQ